MAEGSGIDRKADERMEFTTSKDVTVAPTFQDSKLAYLQGSLYFIFIASIPLWD